VRSPSRLVKTLGDGVLLETSDRYTRTVNRWLGRPGRTEEGSLT